MARAVNPIPHVRVQAKGPRLQGEDGHRQVEEHVQRLYWHWAGDAPCLLSGRGSSGETTQRGCHQERKSRRERRVLLGRILKKIKLGKRICRKIIFVL